MNKVKRGRIFWVQLQEPVGSVQGGKRPVLVVSNDVGNEKSDIFLGAIITSRNTKAKLPTHYWIKDKSLLPKDSMVEFEQIHCLSKKQIVGYVGELSQDEMRDCEWALMVSLGL